MTDTLMTHYRTHPLYRHFPQETRPIASLGTGFLRVEQEQVDAVDPAMPAIVTTLVIEADRGHCTISDGLNRISEPIRTGTFHVVPANADVHFQAPQRHVLVALPFPVDHLSRMLEMEVGALLRDLEPLHRRMQDDALIRHLMLAAWREAARDDPAAALFIDGAVLAISAAMLRLAGVEGQAAPAALDDRRLARAAEHVEAHLEATITLDAMADVAGLSPFHFNRAFRAATGRTPHQYVTARRIERARRLLTTDMPAAQVAFACGFASQSHFGQVFKAATGLTPRAYRTAVAS
ncbi:MAG: AraC family transcriptional regulator [Pseudomonadota bacterium]